MCVDIPIGKKPITENPLTAKPITEKHVESNINVCNKRSIESSIYQSKKKIEEVREQVKEAIAYDKLTDEYEAGDLDLIVKVMTEIIASIAAPSRLLRGDPAAGLTEREAYIGAITAIRR